MSLRIVSAIARKDIVDAMRNLYIMGAIVLPVIFWLLFRVVFSSEAEIKIGPVAIYDNGSSRLVEQLVKNPIVEGVVETGSFDELSKAVRKEALGGLVLPPDFDAAVVAGQSPELTVLYNGRRGGVELAAFRRLVDQQLGELAGRPPVARVVWRDVNESSAPTDPGGTKGLDFTFVILLVMGLAMAGTFVVPTLLVEEKEKHTLKTILVSPASYTDVVAGKAIVGLFYSLLGAVVLLVLYGALRGNLPLLGLAVLLGSLFMVGVGLLLGTLFRTMAQVNSWSSIVMVLLILPTWVTGISVSDAVSGAMRVLPSHYLVQLVEAARSGTPADDLWMSVGVLVGCIAILFVSVVLLLKRIAAGPAA